MIVVLNFDGELDLSPFFTCSSITIAVHRCLTCDFNVCTWQVCELAEEAYINHAVGDLLYHIEHEGQQPEF